MNSGNHMLVIAEFPAEDILPRIGKGKSKEPFTTPYGIFDVKMSSNRLECLRRNQTCMWCGKTGTFFRLEMEKVSDIASRSASPHLNLYHRSKRGALFLMTQDHLHPRSLGGKDDLSNLITMCDRCNQKKGNRLFSELTDENMACARKYEPNAISETPLPNAGETNR